MGVWKVNATCDQDGFDGFLAGLLCIETQVFKVSTGYRDFCSCEVASGAVQPLLGIVGRKSSGGFLTTLPSFSAALMTSAWVSP